ncbi:MAG TPA: UDP-3-O-(3-hydroxymyristoyl)glucosamine N-acyltransferase [Pyrinomonadaceae bacterium]|nr:UDP-3-O-(3-hydroxymyristoyl)glucosamine N-acyltransferase [Pyrinomonadaceae bacterium]
MKTREIAEFLSGTLSGGGDIEILSVAGIEKAKKGDISFTEGANILPATNASCLIVPLGTMIDAIPAIAVKDPKLAFARIAAVLQPSVISTPNIHSSAIIAADAQIGEGVFIAAFVEIGRGASVGDGTQIHSGTKVGGGSAIGNNCVLHPNVVIESGCSLGDNVIIHAGSVIGADGFGYVRDTNEYVKFPQIGAVVIEDNVEIGANTCIDRGSLGETRIGEGTKIDNLVQIAHNVQIGKRVVIAAQTGISGSTIVEDDCVIGGQVGMGDHARVLSGAVIGSQAGVLPGKIVRAGVWWGTPVQPLDEYKRQNAHLKGIARLKEEIKALKERLDSIDPKGK